MKMIIESLITTCRYPANTTPHWWIAGCISLSLILGIIVGVCYAIFWLDKHLIAVSCGIAVNLMICILVKELCRIPREVSGCGIRYSFPSGHAQTASFIACYFAYQFYNVLCDFTMLPAWAVWQLRVRMSIGFIYLTMVSYSRVYLGINVKEDVMVGITLGGLCTVVYIYFTRFISGIARETTVETYQIKLD